MFGSQVLETALGLILMFFVVSLGASAIVESVSQVLRKRSTDLGDVIGQMIAGSDATITEVRAARDLFRQTSIYDSLRAGSGRSWLLNPHRLIPGVTRWNEPSYVSAKIFADAIAELVDSTEHLPKQMARRLNSIIDEVGGDVTAVKAELEAWFDTVMERLAGAYKRWVRFVLFVVGLGISVGANASAYDVADNLWTDSELRASVATAAELTARGDGSADASIETLRESLAALDESGLPVGWSAEASVGWGWNPLDWTQSNVATTGGWIATAFLVTLGAPFWFDLLTRVVALRTTGSRPPVAGNDPASATANIDRASDTRERRKTQAPMQKANTVDVREPVRPAESF